MEERNIYNVKIILFYMEKRVNFSEGKQKDFFKYVKLTSNFSWKELADKLKVNESTLSKAYRFGVCDIPYDLFRRILNVINKDESTLLREYCGKILNEELVIGRKVFGEGRKILSEIKLDYKNNPSNFDISKVNFSKYDLERGIKLPKNLTPELAEEIGMHFGDGFLSGERYEYRLKGNPKDEKEYYQGYIKPLFKKLFNFEINLKDFKTSYGFELRSKAIWEFKTRILGIKSGNKFNLYVPKILKVNDVKIISAFLRGLFDTDGTVCFKSKYGYENYYPSIEITLISKKVIKDVAEMLKMLGFDPKISPTRNCERISLNGISRFKKYEQLIGWSSPKNLNKVNEWKFQYPELNNGDCNSVVEYATVARTTGVRFSPFALSGQKEKTK